MLELHPCFNEKVCHQSARIHLPVAPSCNVQCNFCNRKFDCVNECRPGVTSEILSPSQAVSHLGRMKKLCPNLAVAGIAGPGDAFADGDRTMKTLAMIRDEFPDLLLCISTNGLGLPPYVNNLVEIGVKHISITVNAVEPEIGAIIYQWVRGNNNRLLRGYEGADRIISRQLESIDLLKGKGITVKVNTVLLPGINDQHITDIACKMAALNVDILNCIPYLPNPGCVFSDLRAPSSREVSTIRESAGKFLPQMSHCRRCRADSVGLLHRSLDPGMINPLKGETII